jgi:hypothetical protein
MLLQPINSFICFSDHEEYDLIEIETLNDLKIAIEEKPNDRDYLEIYMTGMNRFISIQMLKG